MTNRREDKLREKRRDKMKKLFIILTFSLMLLLTGCSQYAARNSGGDFTHNLPSGEKLINVTWKDDTLWFLTRPMEEDDEVETYKFQANSVFGVFEGTVTIVENK